MDELFELFNEQLNILSGQINDIRKTANLIMEEKKKRDDSYMFENPFIKFLEIKKSINNTHMDIIDSKYNEFINTLKDFVNDYNGIEDEDYLWSKSFITNFISSNSNENTYSLFKEFVNNNSLKDFINELQGKKKDSYSGKEYEDFEKNMLKLMHIISRKKYPIAANESEIDKFKKHIEENDNIRRKKNCNNKR